LRERVRGGEVSAKVSSMQFLLCLCCQVWGRRRSSSHVTIPILEFRISTLKYITDPIPSIVCLLTLISHSPTPSMGCGDDIPSINANAKPSYMRQLCTPYMPKPEAQIEHYEIAQEHEQDLQRVLSSQSARRPSHAAYVDPNDEPTPAKTTHQHYHRRASEGWKERVRKEVMTPSEQRGLGPNAGLTREDVLARGYPSRGSSGVVVSPSRPIVPNGMRQRRFLGIGYQSYK